MSAPDAAPRPQRRWDPENLSYAHRRGVLEDLGFSTYEAYLRSEFWREIRERIFEELGHECWICRLPGAWQVHHAKYTVENLRGDSLRFLHPICAVCHEEIEMDGDRKRTPAETRKRARELRKSRAWRERLSTIRRKRRSDHAELRRLNDRDE